MPERKFAFPHRPRVMPLSTALFQSRAEAEASLIGSADMLVVFNDRTVADGWSDVYEATEEASPSDTVFQSADGQWWKLVSKRADDAGLLEDADGIHVPEWLTGVDLRGYEADSEPVRMPFVRVGASEPPDSLKFQDDGNDWWKLSRHYTTLKDHGYTRGQDVAPVLQRALTHCMASVHCRTLVLEAPDEDFYILTAPAPATANYHFSSYASIANLAIIGPGRDLCRFKRVGTAVRGMLHFENTEGLRLEGFSFDQDGSVGSGHHGMAFQNIFGLRTDNLGVHNTQGYGIGIENTDRTAERIGRWLVNDTLIENAGSDGIDVKAPTNHNEQIIVSTLRVKGWSLYNDTDNGFDNRFVGTNSNLDFEFTDNMGAAACVSNRPYQVGDIGSGGGFSTFHGVQIKGTRGTSNNAKYQLGFGIGCPCVNVYGLSVRNLNDNVASYAFSVNGGSDSNVYGLSIDRCYGGISLGASSNISIYNPVITRCTAEGIRATPGSNISNRVIAPRVEECQVAYYVQSGGSAMTVERPKQYNNVTDYVLTQPSRFLGPAEAIKTVPYANVRLATTGYVNILSALENGDTIDGTVLATGDRVLVKNQASAVATHTVRVLGIGGTFTTQYDAGNYCDGVVLAAGDRILLTTMTPASVNGIYVVQASGAPVRATDADTAGEFSNMIVTVTEGEVHAGKIFVCASIVTTLGTSNINFVRAGALNGVYVVPASGAATRATDSNVWSAMGSQTYYVTAGSTNISQFYTARGHNIILDTHPFTFLAGPAANNYEVIDEDYTLLCDATAANLTIQFSNLNQDSPAGRVLEVVKIDASANTVILNPISSQGINGVTSMSLTTQYEGVRCKSNGASWYKF